MPKNTPFLDERHKQRIQTSMILNRLNAHIAGEIQLSSTQVAAAALLLRKVMPDLSSMDHKGEVTVHKVVSPEPTVAEWTHDHAEQPSRAH